MDKKKIKNVVKTGIKALGGLGASRIVYNIMPYEGPLGTVACYTFGFFVVMATQDMIDKQLLKCEMILKQIEDGADFIAV